MAQGQFSSITFMFKIKRSKLHFFVNIWYMVTDSVTVQLSSNRKSYIRFRLAYLNLIFGYFEGQVKVMHIS